MNAFLIITRETSEFTFHKTHRHDFILGVELLFTFTFLERHEGLKLKLISNRSNDEVESEKKSLEIG